MNRNVRAMISLIASEICGRVLDKSQCTLTDSELARLYRLSKDHDLAHLVGNALIKNSLISNDEIRAEFQKQIMLAVYRQERLDGELNRLRRVLNAAEIRFIPLKGAVLRRYYPEPWMRTSCDIDILVHESDLERTLAVLKEKMAYRPESKGSHDVGLFSEGGVHVELHYGLIEERCVEGAEAVLRSAWDDATAVSGGCEYALSDAMFYFYHVAHMAKHFVGTGGCGVRAFADIWILKHRVEHDSGKREELLEKGGLADFARQAELLSEIWFGNAEHTELTKRLEAYILRGGVYGTAENSVIVQQQLRGGKLRYALSKIFIPYDVIRFHYPILQRHRWLTPVMEVRRWGKLIFCGSLKRVAGELRYNGAISEDTAADARDFLEGLGLRNKAR